MVRAMYLEEKQVLVVDDSDFSAQLLKSLLHAAGVRSVLVLPSAEEGLAYLSHDPAKVDLAIVDWIMPDMSGLDMLKAIRAPDSPRRDLPVILISGEPLRERVEAARSAGAHNFLVKPLSAQRLKNAVYTALDCSRPFIVRDSYVGPCRRWREGSDYDGVERRVPLAARAESVADMRDVGRD